MRFMMLAIPFVLFGCEGESTSNSNNSNNSTSQTCTTDWQCVNGECECEDGSACDDPDHCDEVCEICE